MKRTRIGNGLWYEGDCLEIMARFKPSYFDMVLCDLPYGTTACFWDSIIPFESLWDRYLNIVKDTKCFCLFGSEPFSTKLRMSNLKMFKYDWIWEKSKATGHVHAKNKPMKIHEIVSIFSSGNTLHKGQSPKRMLYNPQGLIKLDSPKKLGIGGISDTNFSKRKSHKETWYSHIGYPKSIIKFSRDAGAKAIHPTQKPVALFEYLIKTYTNPRDIILDNCAGSGTTAIAAENTGRRWVCIEKDPTYSRLAVERIRNHLDEKDRHSRRT